MDPNGLITIQSHSDPSTTMRKLQDAVTSRGLTIFAHVDHRAGAVEAGMTLRPTDLLIFGSPKGGTPLMQAAQTSGIDLPLKVLVWQDAEGRTWLSYNDPAWLLGRHGRPAAAEPAVRAMTGALEAIAGAAASEASPQ
ncbi:DUF302 domain-containing protein [Bradyrhizobium oligotrophicum]|uniref:DUF302 domain-containing protein n=2 Tax=Bradyrhizobium oligotrophicum TaxID=44255 RepID=UPI003EB6E425